MEQGELLRLLAIANYRLYLATAQGNPSPNNARLNEALSHPAPGDLVMETTTMFLPREDEDRFGRLIMARREVLPYADEEEAQLNNHEVIRDTFTYIERVDGTLRRWRNCVFIRVLEDLRNDSEDTQARRDAWVREAKRRHELEDD